MRFILALITSLALLNLPVSAATVFPSISSEDLNGVLKDLPQDLPGNPTIVFLAYKQGQQSDVDNWVYKMGLDPSQGAEFVELPIAGRGARLIKRALNNGMRSGILDPDMRARTITIYESVNSLNKPLGFKDRDEIRILLVRQNGEVLWSASGEATPSKIGELKSLYTSTK